MEAVCYRNMGANNRVGDTTAANSVTNNICVCVYVSVCMSVWCCVCQRVCLCDSLRLVIMTATVMMKRHLPL